jgi:uncharacterized protein (DUF2342 family)
MSEVAVHDLGRTSVGNNQLSSSTLEEMSERALEQGVNLAQLIAKTYVFVEQVSHQKSHAKIDELEKHEKKLKTVTQFLSGIEAQLANPDAREVNMADKSALVEEMHQLLDHKLLTKSVWSRSEADTIKTALTRHSQIIMQQVHHSSSEVNRSIEEGTELLQISRKVLEMYQQLISSFTRNQRV